MNIVEDYPEKSYGFGPVRIPARSRLQVPDATLVEECCLLDVLESMDSAQPKHVIFGVKTDVSYSGLHFLGG